MYLCISLNISVLQHGWIILCTVLDTAAGVWLDRHGMVTSSRPNKAQTEDPALELMRRCRHAASSVGVRIYIYGGLRGDVLLDDFLIAENSALQSDTTESTSNMTSPRTNNSSPFDPMSPDSRPESPSSGALRSDMYLLLPYAEILGSVWLDGME